MAIKLKNNNNLLGEPEENPEISLPKEKRQVYKSSFVKLIAFMLTVLFVANIITETMTLGRLIEDDNSSLSKYDYYETHSTNEYIFSDKFLHRLTNNIRNISGNITTTKNHSSAIIEDFITFYGKIDDKVLTNMKDPENTIKNLSDTTTRYYLTWENNEFTLCGNLGGVSNQWLYSETYNTIIDEKFDELYIVIDEEWLQNESFTWNYVRGFYDNFFNRCAFSLTAALILIIYLTIFTGRKPNDTNLYRLSIDKLWGEFHIITIPTIIACSFPLFLGFAMYGPMINEILAFSIFAIITAITGILYLSLVRKLKTRPIKDQFLSFILIRYCIKYGKVILKKSKSLAFFILRKIKGIFVYILTFFNKNLYKRFSSVQQLHILTASYILIGSFVICLIFASIISGSFFLFLNFGVIFVGITYFYIKKFRAYFDNLKEDFNKSYEETLKADRMKVELITNVSHDLKTPLTSIVSYSDLLCQENLEPVAADYAKIISDKAKRLSTIVSDLFDLSKSTTGNMEFNLEPIELKRLLEQTVADMSDKIEASGQILITRFIDKPITINGDGKKLYRAFQNLLDNALKYTLKGTRIYLTLEVTDELAIIKLVNTASYQMNFDSLEIKERFVRGDNSRTTEGSGLGLSIAESFINNCNGRMKVDVEYDQFKVTVYFPYI